MPTPFNPEVHDNLLPLGFTWTQYEADWYDDGDAESGPHLAGGPGFDEYLRESDMTKVCVDEDGAVGYFGDADPYDFVDQELIERATHEPQDEPQDVMGDWMGRNV